MRNTKTVRGTHFACVHAGPKEGWMQFRLEPPDVPLPARGKLFLRDLLPEDELDINQSFQFLLRGLLLFERQRADDA